MEQSSPHLKKFQIQWLQEGRRRVRVLRQESRTPKHQPQHIYSDRLSQLENDMAKIRDGTMKEVLEKLRRLSDKIEEIDRRFISLDRKGNTLDDFRVRVDYYESEMANLRRKIE